jgi:hypothetical protein
MRAEVVVTLVVMLVGMQSFCLGEEWNRSGNPSGQKVAAQEKPAAKVEIYVTDW